ncbi:MAG TPA: DUF3035 domain-containing protein [Sphingomicrobium sp.]
MRKALSAVLVVAALSTSGCAVLRSKSRAPDEFAVARNAPLIIPPDFSLAPPVAGTAGTATDVQQQAIDAIFGGPAPRSASENTLLDTAGRASAEMGIRTTVRDPNTRVVDKGPTTLAIIAAPPANSEIATAQ